MGLKWVLSSFQGGKGVWVVREDSPNPFCCVDRQMPLIVRCTIIVHTSEKDKALLKVTFRHDGHKVPPGFRRLWSK